LSYLRRALVFHLRRRLLRGRHPPCGTLSDMRSLTIRRPVCSRICLKSGLRNVIAGPLIEIITRRMPTDLALANASLMAFSVANCDERFDFLKPTVPPDTKPSCL